MTRNYIMPDRKRVWKRDVRRNGVFDSSQGYVTFLTNVILSLTKSEASWKEGEGRIKASISCVHFRSGGGKCPRIFPPVDALPKKMGGGFYQWSVVDEEIVMFENTPHGVGLISSSAFLFSLQSVGTLPFYALSSASKEVSAAE